MSKTDLHFLNPWEFRQWAEIMGYRITADFCDWSWGNGDAMVEDLRRRIPLALKDGGIPYDKDKFVDFMVWLDKARPYDTLGATAVYRIDL